MAPVAMAGKAAIPAACVILVKAVVPAEGVTQAKAVIPAESVSLVKVVIPAQAGIHGCACCRWRCREFGLPAPRQVIPVGTATCGGAWLHTDAGRRSKWGAAKPRAPTPQRFIGAVGAAPDRPATPGLAAASRNSLRSLRSLRSDSRDESVDESRCARGRKP